MSSKKWCWPEHNFCRSYKTRRLWPAKRKIANHQIQKERNRMSERKSLVHELKLFKSSFQHLFECSLSKPALVERCIATGNILLEPCSWEEVVWLQKVHVRRNAIEIVNLNERSLNCTPAWKQFAWGKDAPVLCLQTCPGRVVQWPTQNGRINDRKVKL